MSYGAPAMAIAWIDVETTGLSPDDAVLLELAVILTNSKGDIMAQDSYVINQPDEELRKMVPKVREMHSSSGLLKEVRGSSNTVESVEKEVLRLIREHVSAKQAVYIGGSSVHFDRSFIKTYMPSLNRRLHYRHMDSTVLTLAADIAGGRVLYHTSEKTAHRAMADIQYSLEVFKGALKALAL